MVDAIVTVLVVLAIFVVVASLLTVYVWRVDPRQFAVWRAILLSRRVSRPQPLVATMPPVPAADKSATARLEYWVEDDR